MSTRLLTVRIEHEADIVAARQRARQIAAALHFDAVGQTRLATAVSEIARNAFQYAGGGTVEYRIAGSASPQLLIVKIADSGPGIPHLDRVLTGQYTSPTGMGLGLVGTRRLMDQFEIHSGTSGTVVTLKKLLPPRAPMFGSAEIARLTGALARGTLREPLEEVRQQNQELLRTLDILQARQEELECVNRELEDTNRGVVALYAELDERADHLRRADELKTRFLSNMTHEFRTPVNSILALTSLLADRLEAPPDQKDELFYIRKSAQQLSDIVDDLLDIAKVEAGKIEVRPAPFEVAALFGALRGMLRPLLVNQSLSLIFEEPDDVPPIFSDESKVSQVLRNFISNALKYTERGEVRVSAGLTASRDAVTFTVADTGIGIPAADLPRIFDEFVQIENPLQRRVKGTGLGLPLSKRLAELLGGSIAVTSVFGEGSTFQVTVPLLYGRSVDPAHALVEPGRMAVLVIEDSDEDILLMDRFLAGSRYQIVPAQSVAAAQTALEAMRPAAIMLDIRLHGLDSWDLLAKLKRDHRTSTIPLLVISTLDDPQKAFALGADAYRVKPADRAWLLSTLDDLVFRNAPLRVLAVDDEDTSRFIVHGLLSSRDYEVIDARSGAEGVALAQALEPDVVLVDFRLTDMTGLDVCDRLEESAATAAIPVVLMTSQLLSPLELQRLRGRRVLAKSDLTRETLRDAIDATAAARQHQRPEANRA